MKKDKYFLNPAQNELKRFYSFEQKKITFVSKRNLNGLITFRHVHSKKRLWKQSWIMIIIIYDFFFSPFDLKANKFNFKCPITLDWRKLHRCENIVFFCFQLPPWDCLEAFFCFIYVFKNITASQQTQYFANNVYENFYRTFA